MGNKFLKLRKVVWIMGIAVTLTAFQNCSDVSFDQGSSSSSSNGVTPGLGQSSGDGANGNLGQNGDPNNPGGTGGTGGTVDPNTPPGGVGGTGPVNNPPGGTTPPGGTVTPGTPTAPSGVVPKVIFVGPPCMRGTNCLVAFQLDQPYAANVDFDWHTNDTIYTTPSTPIYGKPNYHYVPIGGHITFTPGTVRKEVYIQNINPDNVAILIGVTMRTCTYGGAAQLCSQFFRP